MPDETLKVYWEIVSQIRRAPTQQLYALAISHSTIHPHPKVRNAFLAFLAAKRNATNVA